MTARRAAIRRWSLAAAMAGGVASALVALTGGFDLQAAGVAVSAHDPLRPLLFAALALTVYLLGT